MPSSENHDFAFQCCQWAVFVYQVLDHIKPGVFSTIDVASHVGGAVVGFAGAWLIKRQAALRRAGQEKVVLGKDVRDTQG